MPTLNEILTRENTKEMVNQIKAMRTEQENFKKLLGEVKEEVKKVQELFKKTSK